MTRGTIPKKPVGIADRIYAWLEQGRRCSAEIAASKWGYNRSQYNTAIGTLRQRPGVQIDADRMSKGDTRRVTHTLVR